MTPARHVRRMLLRHLPEPLRTWYAERVMSQAESGLVEISDILAAKVTLPKKINRPYDRGALDP